MPFPALDGGRILFLAIERVIRRKLPQNAEAWVNVAGFGLLLLLILVITVRDVGRIFFS
jgi:regulator of sigma E protease